MILNKTDNFFNNNGINLNKLFMKWIVGLLVFALSNLTIASAQNIGVGITEPSTKLQVAGNFLVQTPTIASNQPPTAGQTFIIVNNSTNGISGLDSIFRIYDPGGPGGDYSANITGHSNINTNFESIGIELNIENIALGAGDSLIIREINLPSSEVLLAVGNNYQTPGKWIFSTRQLYITFKSNSDGVNGAGFSLLFKRLFQAPVSAPEKDGLLSKSLHFDGQAGSLRVGKNNNLPRGQYSITAGDDNMASGVASVAMGMRNKSRNVATLALGHGNDASSNSAICIGYYNIASSNYSMAFGQSCIADGWSAIAMGYEATSTGILSTAIGNNAVASGDYSTAIGNYCSTNNLVGSLVIGDNSTTTVVNAATPNSFRARFAGGYRFFTSAAISNAESCQLAAGSNAWSTTSDIRLKENFAAIDGEDFLKKIARLKLVSWNYKNQDPSKFRHYGPMAQDFYAAFGKDKYGTIGNDTTINQADFDGVNMIAIQALEKRTAGQQAQLETYNHSLKQEIELLKKTIRELQETIKAIRPEIK
jgi:hypothetical protein